MPGKWSVKNPLTLDERRKIYEAIQMNMSYREMAEHVGNGRYKSTMIKECKRLGIENYNPEKAQKHFEDIQIRRRKKKVQ